MARLIWDQTGSRYYETGVDHCALYVKRKTTDEQGKTKYEYAEGVAWSGITGITESPSGAEATDVYADNIKYLSLLSAENYGATVEAYTYPDEWEECDGSATVAGIKFGQQPRSVFALAYRTKIGNDEAGDEAGYKIHIIYNAKASPSELAHNTTNESPEAPTMSWTLTTTSEAIPDVKLKDGTVIKLKATAHLEISSLDNSEDVMNAIENALFGRDANEASSLPEIKPHLLLPAELIAMADTTTVSEGTM